MKDDAYGGYSDDDSATRNTLTIRGEVKDDVWGGYAGNGTAERNEVLIEGGTAGYWVHGGEAFYGDATENTITLADGTVSHSMYGGYATEGNATGNQVFINGGTADSNVYGGGANEGNATGNTVTLAGGAVKGAVLGGDCSHSSLPCDETTGNTLAVHAQGSTVGAHVDKYEKLEFKLPAGVAGNTMLKVGDDAAFPTFGAPSTTEVKIALADGAKLKKDESITLIETGTNGSGVLEIKLASTTVTTPDGYVFELTADATKLVAKVDQEPQPPTPDPTPDPDPNPDPNPNPAPGTHHYSDNSSPTMGELGLLLSGLALAGAAAPALRRREKQGKKADTRQ